MNVKRYPLLIIQGLNEMGHFNSLGVLVDYVGMSYQHGSIVANDLARSGCIKVKRQDNYPGAPKRITHNCSHCPYKNCILWDTKANCLASGQDTNTVCNTQAVRNVQ